MATKKTAPKTGETADTKADLLTGSGSGGAVTAYTGK